MPDHQLTPDQLAKAIEAKAVLEELFDAPLELRLQGPQEDPATTFDVLTAAETIAGQVLAVTPGSDSPQSNRPLPEFGNDDQAPACESPTADSALLEKISQLSQENETLRCELHASLSEMDEYADEVLRGFEERTWLTELTEHLEFCHVENSVEDVAARLLPHLREIINAQTIAFIAQCSDGAAATVGEERIRDGDTTVDADQCRCLVERYRHDAITQPVVRNRNGMWAEADEIAGVDAFILVPMTKEQDCIGWLLAVNPTQYDSATSVDCHDGRFIEDKFSTVEARLMSSAAMILATHEHNVQLFQANESLTVGVVRSLANAIDAKDPYTRGHSDRVGRMARQLGQRLQLGRQKCEQLLMTGLLHDIGKIGVPDSVLRKPGRLTEAEFKLIKQHPEIGHQILEHIGELGYALAGVLHHHEAFNGSGYPLGLIADQIPVAGRILAIVDAYDAMTSNRPYRDGMSFDKAEDIIRDGAGTYWDPEIVDVFLRHNDDFQTICLESPDHCCSFPERLDDSVFCHPETTHLESVLAEVIPPVEDPSLSSDNG